MVVYFIVSDGIVERETGQNRTHCSEAIMLEFREWEWRKKATISGTR